MTGALLVALSALGYSTNPILGKFAYQAGANALTLLSIRYLMAATGLWLIVASQRSTPRLPVAKRLQLLAMGAFGMGMVSLLYFTALEHIGASLATGLFYMHPALVAVVGAFRGEGIGKAGVAGLLLTAAGTWLLLGTDLGGFTWQGALLILAAACLYSGYMVVSDPWTRGVPPFAVSAHVTTGAAVVLLLMAVVTGQSVPGAGAFLAGGGLALLATIVAMSAFFAGLPKVGPTRAAIISTLEPVFTALLAVMLLGEHLSGLQLAGVGLVVAGAVAAQQRDRTGDLAKEA